MITEGQLLFSIEIIETVQMRGHNIGFYAEITKIIPHYQQ